LRRPGRAAPAPLRARRRRRRLAVGRRRGRLPARGARQPRRAPLSRAHRRGRGADHGPRTRLLPRDHPAAAAGLRARLPDHHHRPAPGPHRPRSGVLGAAALHPAALHLREVPPRAGAPRPPGRAAPRPRRPAPRPAVVFPRPRAAGRGAEGRGREPARRPSGRLLGRQGRLGRVHPVGAPRCRRRRADHADHEDGLRLRLPHRPQGLRRRHHRRAGELRRRRRRRAVRVRRRSVQLGLRLVRLQGRPGVPADHPRAAGALAPARRLRGARRVSGRPVPDGAGAGGGPAVRPAQGGAVGLWLRRGLLVALLAVVVALPFVAGPFGLRLANLIGMYALVVLGLVLLTGYAGLASLGQAAFVGTSAYTAAILASRFGVNPWPSIAAGVVASVAIAWLMGAITLRLKGHFLALATLAWGLVITGVLRNWMAVTGGNTGFGSATGNRIPPLTFLGDPIRGDREYYVL